MSPQRVALLAVLVTAFAGLQAAAQRTDDIQGKSGSGSDRACPKEGRWKVQNLEGWMNCTGSIANSKALYARRATRRVPQRLREQDFGFLTSKFYSDVWSSEDGIEWTERTSDAGWEPRAGLRAVTFRDEIYVFGGSQFDEQSLPGPTGPARIYYNDVWKSADGAPWALRAGAVVVVKDDYMVLPGGEAGFLCDPLPSCELPYFNDVWRYALPTP